MLSHFTAIVHTGQPVLASTAIKSWGILFEQNFNVCVPCSRQLHCVSKEGYHPTTNDNFDNSCPIPVIFGTNIAE